MSIHFSVKDAARTALKYVADVFESETISNLGLEEVRYVSQEDAWDVRIDRKITSSFRGVHTSCARAV